MVCYFLCERPALHIPPFSETDHRCAEQVSVLGIPPDNLRAVFNASRGDFSALDNVENVASSIIVELEGFCARAFYDKV